MKTYVMNAYINMIKRCTLPFPPLLLSLLHRKGFHATIAELAPIPRIDEENPNLASKASLIHFNDIDTDLFTYHHINPFISIYHTMPFSSLSTKKPTHSDPSLKP